MSDKFLFFNNLKKCKNFFCENINKRKHLIFQGVKHVWRFFLTERNLHVATNRFLLIIKTNKRAKINLKKEINKKKSVLYR